MKQVRMKTGKTDLRMTSVDRSGATLMEVLMSVMIMGLGVIPLATLFPLSVQRSIQATQLTNATILRYNAEAMIDAFPGRLLHDPDNDGNRNEHRFQNRKYVVDPIGFLLADNATYQGRFGNDGQGAAFGPILRYDAGFTALSSGPNFFSQQDSWKLQFEGIPTSNTLTSLTFDSADLSAELLTDISQNAVAGSPVGILSRVVIFDEEGNEAQVRVFPGPIPPADIASRTIQGFAALPANFRYVDSLNNGIVSKVRIEIQEQRYTYLLSVRHQPTRVAAVDVVVFFKRDFSPEREVIHSVSDFVSYLPGDDGAPGVAGVDDNQDGTDDDPGELGWKGSDDEPNNKFTLHFNDRIKLAPLNLAEDDVRPPLKKGGYIFDVRNARWYRIQKVTDIDSRNAEITLDQPIAQSILNSAGNAVTADGVMVRSDVIQVYSLGNKLDPVN